MSSYVAFYHYTDTAGKNGILSSGYIREKAAQSKHAQYGPGTYGTSLAPSAGKRKIAENNWRTHWQSMINNGRMDWVIKVNVPSHLVSRYGAVEGRDILVYNGPLSLHGYTKGGHDVAVVVVAVGGAKWVVEGRGAKGRESEKGGVR